MLWSMCISRAWTLYTFESFVREIGRNCKGMLVGKKIHIYLLCHLLVYICIYINPDETALNPYKSTG